MTRTVDFLVVGSGISGLSFALKAAKHGKVLIVTKSTEDESSTKYAQGGVAVVVDKKEDSFEKHIEDTLISGDGLCDKEVVDAVAKEGPDRVGEIIDYGTNFDKTTEGFYDLAKEGGHSEFRVLHHKDITGLEIERSLLEQIHSNPNIEILTHYFAADLITQHHLGVLVSKSTTDITCYGIYALNKIFDAIKTKLKFYNFDEQLYGTFNFQQAPRHTPGFTLTSISSNGEKLLYVADLIHSDIILFPHPEWGFSGDTDIDIAVASRIRVLKQLADNKTRAHGYHLPWPRLGFVKSTQINSFVWIQQTFETP